MLNRASDLIHYQNISTRIVYPSIWPPGQQRQLDNLFIEARAKGLWFYHNSISVGPLWFTPDELQAENEKDQFVWAADNWQLRPPLEALSEAQRRFLAARDELARTKDKVLGAVLKPAKEGNTP
jgi:hypothetical protein